MRGLRLLVLVIALVPATTLLAASGGLTVTSSSREAGAHNVRVTLVARYEMQCGYPGVGPAEIHWPGGIAAHVAPSAVLVNGKPAPSVRVGRHVVSVGMPPRPQVMCDAIGPGKLTIVLTSRAGVANPSAGAHAVVVTKGAMRFSASLAIG